MALLQLTAYSQDSTQGRFIDDILITRNDTLYCFTEEKALVFAQTAAELEESRELLENYRQRDTVLNDQLYFLNQVIIEKDGVITHQSQIIKNNEIIIENTERQIQKQTFFKKLYAALGTTVSGVLAILYITK